MRPYNKKLKEALFIQNQSKKDEPRVTKKRLKNLQYLNVKYSDKKTFRHIPLQEQLNNSRSIKNINS